MSNNNEHKPECETNFICGSCTPEKGMYIQCDNHKCDCGANNEQGSKCCRKCSVNRPRDLIERVREINCVFCSCHTPKLELSRCCAAPKKERSLETKLIFENGPDADCSACGKPFVAAGEGEKSVIRTNRTSEFPLGKDNYCPQCYFEDDVKVLKKDCKHRTPKREFTAISKSYERDFSHSHCWNQGKSPACGQPLENHKQCCLCDTPAPQKDEEWQPELRKLMYSYAHDVIKNFEGLSEKPMDSWKLLDKCIPEFIALIKEREEKARAAALLDIDNEVSKLLSEVANTPLDKRNAWKTLIELRDRKLRNLTSK